MGRGCEARWSLARRSPSSRTWCTTGGSTIKAIERARIHGLDVKRVFTLVDREEGGRETVEKEVPLTALFKKSDFR